MVISNSLQPFIKMSSSTKVKAHELVRGGPRTAECNADRGGHDAQVTKGKADLVKQLDELKTELQSLKCVGYSGVAVHPLIHNDPPTESRRSLTPTLPS